MGRRSRRREGAPPEQALEPAVAARARPADARPKAPWHPFPLVELCVLVGLGLCVAGFLNLEDEDGRIMLVAGMALASLAGLDTAVREHFAGFRSHSTLLAGLPAVLAAGGLYFAGAPWPVLVLIAAGVFAGVVVLARGAFRRRSGGLSFKVR